MKYKYPPIGSDAYAPTQSTNAKKPAQDTQLTLDSFLGRNCSENDGWELCNVTGEKMVKDVRPVS